LQRHGWVQQRQLQAGHAVMLGHTDVRTAGFQQRITNFLVQQGDAASSACTCGGSGTARLPAAAA
jgi:multidrug resistance efflux pump